MYLEICNTYKKIHSNYALYRVIGETHNNIDSNITIENSII